MLSSLAALPSLRSDGPAPPTAGFAMSTDRSIAASTATPAARSLLGERATRDWSGVARPAKQARLAKRSMAHSVRDRRADILEGVIASRRARTMERVEKNRVRQMDRSWRLEKDRILAECDGGRPLLRNGAEEKKDDGGALVVASASATNRDNLLRQPLPPEHLNKQPNIEPRLLDRRIETHAEAVYRSYSGTDPRTPATEELLHRLLSLTGEDDDSTRIPFETSYRTALRLLRWTRSSSNPITGALLFLCHESRTIIADRVQKARAAGQDGRGGDNDFASMVKSYVRVKYGSHGHSIYHILYFCLRCGDAVAAKSAIEAAMSDGEQVEGPLREAINTLSDRQGTASCLWEVHRDGENSPLLLPITTSQTLELLGQQQQQQHRDNIYFSATIALLSDGLVPVPSSSEHDGLNTIEDYMFGHFILPDANDAVKNVGALILEYGPAHFNFDIWSYVLPLLVAQQYAPALSYLARAGGLLGLLQATHLGLVIGDPIASDLLVSYATEISARDDLSILSTKMALEYLLRLPDVDKMEKQIASLVAANFGAVELHGTISTDGMRENALLDVKLPRPNVDSILSQAAHSYAASNRQSYNRRDAEAAGMFFLLSGEYATFLTFLNHLLASPDKPENDKAFWCDQTRQFHEAYLEKRSRVLEVLEQRNQLSVVSTNVTLMKFHEFFTLLQQNRVDQARNLIFTEVDILPTRNADMDAKVQRFYQLDPVVQTALPAVLLSTMECLFHLRDGVTGALVATFAGLVLTDGNANIMGRIAQIRSQMG